MRIEIANPATIVFGTANDLTLAELTLKCLYPTDNETRRGLNE